MCAVGLFLIGLFVQCTIKIWVCRLIHTEHYRCLICNLYGKDVRNNVFAQKRKRLGTNYVREKQRETETESEREADLASMPVMKISSRWKTGVVRAEAYSLIAVTLNTDSIDS